MVVAIEIEKLQPKKEEKTKSAKQRQQEVKKGANCSDICACVFLTFCMIGVVIGFVTLFGTVVYAIATSEPQKSNREVILDNAKELKAIQTKMQEMRLEMQEQKSDVRAVFGRLVEAPRKENTTRIVFEVPEIKSIRKDIEGTWKLVDQMNFDGYQKAHDSLNLNFEKFSENLRFDTLPDGRLVQTGGGSEQLIEDSSKKSEFYEEGNHLKSYWSLASTADRFVQDGKLIRIDFFEGGVAKREYHKI